MENIAQLVRYIVTGGIWVAFIIPTSIMANNSGMATTSGMNSGQILFTILAFAMAFLTTFFVWDGAEIIKMSLSDDYKAAMFANESSKRKNTDEHANAALLLLDLLSDEERKTIRQRLIQSDDGEIPAIFANEDDTYQYRS